ncbi:poly(ethylene terephthalate) hydrolase family protein [Flavobacterium sedimenticola]|uniref:T9SS type A sorting domain-containing protein n=1 Tax=Flavobacterium sedimenticola TaxID=3043286 RepID=A0ABT6XSP1_9FLAO|nr:T9SS type A sorting domain-containing protein [Flavobacterium sedimenticola]MDI9258114.1 T9SS type A sorting domain-containing protein [Flavobacterium sedimenticola]
MAQTYQIGHTTINFTDSSRGNRVIATEVYYPADFAGDNVPLANDNVVFPTLSFGHGFVMTWDAYQNFWTSLVPNGYIMLFPKTEGSISPSHLDFGKDLAFILNQMLVLNSNSASLFYNRVSTMNAVMGHSMGGGASFLAAQLNSNITTLVNFAAAETNPSAITAAGLIAIPSLVFSGSNDCVTPPNAHQIPMYSALAGQCKTLISITGGSHCQMANSNFLCNFGESSCSPQASISRASQQAIINSYLIPWLNFQLKGDCNAGSQFDAQITADTAITFQKNCLLCPSLSVDTASTENTVTIYPNPTDTVLMVRVAISTRCDIIIFDGTGKKIVSETFTESTNIDTADFSEGVYYYIVSSENKIVGRGKFIK